MNAAFIVSCLFAMLLSVGACGATATKSVSDSRQRDPKREAAELYDRGRIAAEQGDTVRAEQYLLMARDQGFDQRRVLPMLLDVCLAGSRLRAALDHAQDYLRKHPHDHALRYLVATIHVSLHQSDQARLELEHLLRLDPRNANAHFLLGVLDSDSAPERASRYFRQYLSLAENGEHYSGSVQQAHRTRGAT